MKKSLALNAILFCGSMLVTAAACSSTGIVRSTESYNFNERKDVTSKIVVDLSKKGQNIDRAFYGSHFDSFSQAPAANLVQELGIGRLRIGGNEFDVFNWKNNLSYTKTGVHNLLGLGGIAALLRDYKVGGIYQINLSGYQPVLEGNSVVLKNSFTAESAYEMIKVLNGQLKLGITDISLGNEPEQWHETHPHTKAYTEDSGISADEYIERYIAFAVAVRQAQAENNGDANSIKIWGPEISSSWLDWNTGNFTKDCQWSPTIRGQVDCKYGDGSFTHFIPYFLDRLAKAEKDPAVNPKGYKLLDNFAFHYYPNFRTKIDDVNSIVKDADGRQWVSKILEGTRILHDSTYTNTIDISSYRNANPNIIPRMKGWLKAYYPNAKLVINEFAVDSDWRSNTYHPIIRPLYIADTLGIAAKEGVSFFNNFALSNKEGSNIPWAMLDGGTKKTNNFHTYALFTNHFKGTMVATDDNMGDVVNAYATAGANFVNVAIVNKSPVDKTVQIYIKNGNARKIATYVVPGWSTSILKLEQNPSRFAKGFEVNKFGADQMGIAKDTNYK
ncbi:glycoside hydrolase family 44 protein [Bdellovibrio sp. HCB274]|uniref:glycoside hydrolase family 44 protein n=1 Tax=Bdellovibrio sp. HCB274 TaxID=3394361 RepID=UPI0039B444E8